MRKLLRITLKKQGVNHPGALHVNLLFSLHEIVVDAPSESCDKQLSKERTMLIVNKIGKYTMKQRIVKSLKIGVFGFIVAFTLGYILVLA